ncbi:hypothetical protein D3C80_414900 [compost metagenome]
MVAAEASRDFRLDLRGLKVFLAQIVCDGAVENIGDDPVDIVGGENVLDALHARPRLCRLRLRQNKGAIGFGQLLIGKQAVIAGRDQIMFGPEFLHGKIGIKRALAQFRNTVGQPVAGPPRRLIFGVQLVQQVGRGHGIDDLRGENRRCRIIGEFQRVGSADALDAEAVKQLVRQRSL